MRRMSQISSKPFGPIRDAYAFFQQHATETEADIRAYLPHIHGMALGDSPLRLLDFGCGDGGFTAALLGSICLPPARLRLALVEPDDVYRHQAIAQLQPYSTQPVQAWPALPPHLHACFDLLGKPCPCHTAEDCGAALARLGEAYSTENVQCELVFADAAENRLTIGR